MSKKEKKERVESSEEITKLTPSQERALVALLASPTIRQAANEAGVTRRSIHRWLREDENFQRQLRATRRQALQHATARLQQLASTAVDALENIVKDENSSSASRVSGIRTTLDFAYRAAEFEDLEERLATVERRLEQAPGKPLVDVKWVEV